MGGVSVLVILFPVFLVLSYLINRDIEKNETKLEIGSRKWLLYSVIFVTSISGVADLVYLLYSFLGGDLTKEFLFKSLTVLVIAGVAFAYYFQELKRGTTLSAGAKVFGGLTSVGVITVLMFGFYTVGLPATQRLHKQDEQRLSHLVTLNDIIASYYSSAGNLPKDLQELNQNRPDSILVSNDPETGEPYTYRVIDLKTFELCGNFKTELDYGNSTVITHWNHKPGRNCFPGQVEQAAN